MVAWVDRTLSQQTEAPLFVRFVIKPYIIAINYTNDIGYLLETRADGRMNVRRNVVDLTEFEVNTTPIRFGKAISDCHLSRPWSSVRLHHIDIFEWISETHIIKCLVDLFTDELLIIAYCCLDCSASFCIWQMRIWLAPRWLSAWITEYDRFAKEGRIASNEHIKWFEGWSWYKHFFFALFYIIKRVQQPFDIN